MMSLFRLFQQKQHQKRVILGKMHYLVTDTSPLSETNSVGLNLVVDVEAMGFSDETMELSGKKEVFEFTDWMTGETIKETFEEGTPFDDTMIGDGGNVNSLQAANDILSGNKGDDLIKGFGGGDRLKVEKVRIP